MAVVNRKYTKEFKKDCVTNYLLNKSKGVKQISKNLGVPCGTLRGWIYKHESETDNEVESSNNDSNSLIIKLKLELIKVKEERDILKKALAIFISN